MRPFAILLCLATILLGTLSANVAAQQVQCSSGVQRCYDNSIETCNLDGLYEVLRACGGTEHYFVSSGEDKAECILYSDLRDGFDGVVKTECGDAMVLPDELCNEGTQRCNQNILEWCNQRGEFDIARQCTNDEVCTIFKHSGGTCLPMDTPQSSALPDPAHCRIFGQQRCTLEGKIEECNSHNIWSTKDDCRPLAKCKETEDHARCVPLPSTLRQIPTKRLEPTTEPTPLYFRSILEPVCETGERACDQEGWHTFECDADGQWTLFERCAFEGNCRFNPRINKKGCIAEMPPSFNKGCEEPHFHSCEIGAYQYCKTVSILNVRTLFGRRSLTILSKYPNMTPAKCQQLMCVNTVESVSGPCKE